MKLSLLALVLCVFASISHAKSGSGLEITPIIGYERTQKVYPTPHSKDRLVYGARARYGLPLISVEAEYTRAQDREDFTSPTRSILETTQRAKLGAVSQLKLIGLVFFNLRAGVSATQSNREDTIGGITTSTTDAIRYNPYAGAGLRVRLGRNITGDADIVAIFRDFPNMNENEYQATAGFTISFP